MADQINERVNSLKQELESLKTELAGAEQLYTDTPGRANTAARRAARGTVDDLKNKVDEKEKEIEAAEQESQAEIEGLIQDTQRDQGNTEHERISTGVLEKLEKLLPYTQCTRALPSTTHLELEGVSFIEKMTDQYSDSDSKKNIDKAIEDKQKLQVLKSRLELLKSLRDGTGETVGADDLKNKLKSIKIKSSEAFKKILKAIKKEDRELETTSWEWYAYLAEAKLNLNPELRKHCFILNADPSKLANSDQFGHGEKMGGISGIGEVHKNIYGLWVLGTELSTENTDDSSPLGVKAKKHSALAITNIKLPKTLTDKRRDKKVEATLNSPLDLTSPSTPVKKEDLKFVTGITGNIDGLERIALCLTPVRVRKQTKYDDGEDITVKLSYIYGGKLTYVAMVSPNDGIATSVSRVEKRHAVGGYALSNEPFLLDFEGHREFIEKLPVIAGMYTTGTESDDDMQRSVKHFNGVYTAAGRHVNNQIPTILSYEFLRRIMMVVSRGIEGQPQINRARIRRDVEALLQKNLVGEHAGKPFSSLKVVDDKISAEGISTNKKGGLRFKVNVTAKHVIPEVVVDILPDDVTDDGES